MWWQRREGQKGEKKESERGNGEERGGLRVKDFEGSDNKEVNYG